MALGLIRIAWPQNSNFVFSRGRRSRDSVHDVELPGKTVSRSSGLEFDPLGATATDSPAPEEKAPGKESAPARSAAAGPESTFGKGFSEDLVKTLSIQAVGSGCASWILNMGGQKILVNPNLEGSDIAPESVGEMFDYVLLTCENDRYFHEPTIAKMNFSSTKFVASTKVAAKLDEMMVRYLDTINAGPGGVYMLSRRDRSKAKVAIICVPGAGGERPFGECEQAFLFVNLDTGVALGYAATGQYLGQGAGTRRGEVPEEAYEIDYLVSSDWRESAMVAAKLAETSGELKSLVWLPGSQREFIQDNPLAWFDMTVDSILGGIEDNEEAFREWLKKQKPPLADLKVEKLERGGDSVSLSLR